MSQDRAVRRAGPQTVDDARAEVAASRERMADTLDEIEQHLVSKKEQIEQRLDVMRPLKDKVRARPWPALAVAFGVGVLLWRLRRDGDQ